MKAPKQRELFVFGCFVPVIFKIILPVVIQF